MRKNTQKLFSLLKHLFHPQRSNNHRPKFLHPRALFFLTIIALGFYHLTGFVATVHPVSGSILGYASNISIDQVIQSTNTLRTGSGLGSLNYNPRLSSAAVAKAQNMFSEGYWAHTSPTGREPWDFIKSSGYSYKVAGENLARDFDSTAPMMDAWMNSPTHRANIMNPRYQDIGVAVVDGLLNGIETTLVVQMFGTPATQAVSQQPSVAVPAIATNATVAGVDIQDKNNAPPNKTLEQTNQEEALVAPLEEQTEVLAETVVPQGELSNGILYSPQHILKAFFLSIILILIFVLVYDALVAGHKDSVRFVGKNLAHIFLLIAVLYLIVAFKGGVVSP